LECDKDEHKIDGFDEDCKDFDEGILKLYPLRSTYDMLAVNIPMKI